MLAPVVLVLLAASAGPTGVDAKKPLDEVVKLDALLPELLHDSPQLTALLATDAEMNAMLARMDVNPADRAVILETAKKERTPAGDLPATFSATLALVEVSKKPRSDHEVRFYDANGYRLDLSLMPRGKTGWALSGAPLGQESVVADDLELLHAKQADDGTALPLYFTKDAKGWTPATFPAADPARCVEMMHLQAKKIVDAQRAYHAKHQSFSGDDDTTSVGGAFMGWSTFKPIDADHFRAEVNRHGGKVTVDETGTITDVSACKLVAAKASKAHR